MRSTPGSGKSQEIMAAVGVEVFFYIFIHNILTVKTSNRSNTGWAAITNKFYITVLNRNKIHFSHCPAANNPFYDMGSCGTEEQDLVEADHGWRKQTP